MQLLIDAKFSKADPAEYKSKTTGAPGVRVGVVVATGDPEVPTIKADLFTTPERLIAVNYMPGGPCKLIVQAGLREFRFSLQGDDIVEERLDTKAAKKGGASDATK